ncbi:protein-L-isoaspartate O-methyltransferase [Acidocella sp.]|uniref:protein-L-isoaspartate O-methyltransferase family protein n=1 Tax=Acidocella sp. TaxID=50710 RepID=UPI002606CF3B|nr:protein-L-isoaspartate O-methyltransferase [Acidocella sp.]
MVRPLQTLSRRGVIAGLGASLAAPALADNAAPALPTPATPNAKPWTLQAFEAAMAASGRPVSLTQAQFDAIQARKPAAMAAISDYLTQRLGKADPLVMAAFEAVPREYYHYNYEEHRTTCGDAYDPPPPKTWALGYGSVLSDYEGQAYMTQVIAPKPGEVSLEIGTGSGFQSSVLSRIVDHAYTIEIIAPLGQAVQKIFAPLGYDNISAKVGDGFYGWPEVRGGFDIIVVTCVAQYAPPALFAQLKPGGRMIIPIGQPFKHGQVFYIYHKDAAGKIHSRRDIGCFFIPMTGAMQTAPTPGAATAA